MVSWTVRINTADKVFLCIVGEEPVKNISRMIKGSTVEKAGKNAIKFLKSIALVSDSNPDFAMILQLYINQAVDYISKGASYTACGTHGMSVDVIKG